MTITLATVLPLRSLVGLELDRACMPTGCLTNGP